MKEFSLLIMMGEGIGKIESLWSASEKHSSDNFLTLFFGLMGGGRGGIDLYRHEY